MADYTKRGKKPVNKIYLIIPVIILTALFLGGVYYSQFMMTEYDFSGRLSSLDIDTKISPLAANLALPVEDNVDVDDISSESVILAGGDGSLLASKDATKQMYPASTTKVMTALLALKYGNLSDEVTVTDDSVITEAGASLAGIKPGDKLTLDQLLYGLMLPSGNDAANAIAVHIGGSVDNFVKMMNDEAKRIGAVDTNFVNPSGLSDSNHYTTAYDLYLIFNEAMKDGRFMN
ncbi:MAG: D-alanyl-D-alanine carboxypeptidase family protein, partial [Lachnoanaerobaculum gingivalis]